MRLGEHNLETDGEGSLTEKTVDVKQFINHESFNYKVTKSYDHDICILELTEEVMLTTYTPACLAKSSDATTWDGKNALVYGNMKLSWRLVTHTLQGGAQPAREARRPVPCWRCLSAW